ncbi:MAG: WYL domain-containing protein [Chloroflexi bacterium]|nr:WYL domain-containing protein [Chloroflexota bacterium]
MNRFERILGILLALRSTDSVSADVLAARFEVSRRTIYRDMDALSALGVPVFAEKGTGGGFGLLEGYFLPPLMFTRDEASTLILGLTLLGSLASPPFAGGIDSAERKLLAAVPARLRAVLAETRRIVGFESMPGDLMHPEPAGPGDETGSREAADIFLRAILDGQSVAFAYHSPYRDDGEDVSALPVGLFWDRDRWYLVGAPTRPRGGWRLWRADRVRAMRLRAASAPRPAFDVHALLQRQWLRPAMAQWAKESPVQIRLTVAQAAQLQSDWYFRHARFDAQADGAWHMTYGEDDRAKALALVRWLGPGAELLSPAEWRPQAREELRAMLAQYE